MDVAESYIHKGLKLLADQGHIRKHGERVFNCEVKDVRDGVAVELHGEGFLEVVAAPVAHFALYVDVGHEVHFDAALAVSLTGFAAAARDVETEKRPGLYPRSRASGSIAKRSRIGEKTCV